MAKILSATEAKLQKKLIPLNIFVFILSLAAVISLIFAPIVKVDVGKILREEEVITFAEDTLGKLIDENIDASTEEGFKLDFAPVITAAVVEVLGNARGTIEFSTFEVCKYAADTREDKLEILLDGMVYGKKGIVTELVNSLVEGVTNTFTSDSGKAAVEDALVGSLITSMGSIVENTAGDEGSEIADLINEKLTDEKIGELKETFFEINNAKSEEDVVNVIDTFVGQLNETLGDEYITQENKEAVTEYIVEIYHETISAIEASGDENAEFSLETMICVAVSQHVELEGIDINRLLQEYLEQMGGSGTEENPAAAVKVLVEGEGTESGSGTPSTGNPPLSYGELFSEVGLSPEQVDDISENLNKIVRAYVDEGLSGANESLKEMGWVYQYIYLLILAAIMVFVLPWFILALASLIRIFAKNKRYMMWYVKLLGFIPALIFVAVFVFKTWGAKLIPLIASSITEDKLGLVMSALGGVSSFTWICGLCYILLWLVSIFWAFPIKHKIRKERKACKRAKSEGTYSYGNYKEDYGYSVTQDENPAYAASPDTYDYDDGYDDYEGYDDAYDDDYGFDDYDSEDYGFDDDYDEYSDYDDDY